MIDDNLFKLKPYLKELDRMDTDTELVSSEREKILTSLNLSKISEAQILKKSKEFEDGLDKTFQDGMLDFLNIPGMMETYQQYIVLLKEENQLLVESLVKVSRGYEEVSKKKLQVKEVPRTITKSTEEKDKFSEEMKELLDQFFKDLDTMSPKLWDEAKDTFIREYAKDDTEKIMIMELMANYETKKTKDNSKTKGKSKPKVRKVQE